MKPVMGAQNQIADFIRQASCLYRVRAGQGVRTTQQALQPLELAEGAALFPKQPSPALTPGRAEIGVSPPPLRPFL